ncbi:MAG: type II 3-dehydroquinate dehydratase [Pseudomonadota bacterium]
MAQPAILVLNGPNLNLLGQREPSIYGAATLADLEAACRADGAEMGLVVDCAQSNHEGSLVDLIQQAFGEKQGLVINPGAYSHTSIAILDAIRGVGLPTVEVHLSNIHAREAYRHHSYISPAALGVICGFGVLGYRMALMALSQHLK